MVPVAQIAAGYGSQKGTAVRDHFGEDKALPVVAVEEQGKGTGGTRLRRVLPMQRTRPCMDLYLGSALRTDGHPANLNLHGYIRDWHVQHAQPEDMHLLPRVDRIMPLFKRWTMRTHQEAGASGLLSRGSDSAPNVSPWRKA